MSQKRRRTEPAYGQWWWDGDYKTDGSSWWTDEVDQQGHVILWGWDKKDRRWYQKTHRGKRGKPKSEEQRREIVTRAAENTKRIGFLEKHIELLARELAAERDQSWNSQCELRDLQDTVAEISADLADERERANGLEQEFEEYREHEADLQWEIEHLRAEAANVISASIGLNSETGEELKTERAKAPDWVNRDHRSANPTASSSSLPAHTAPKQEDKKVSLKGREQVKKEELNKDDEVGVIFDYHNCLDIGKREIQQTDGFEWRAHPIPDSVTRAVSRVAEAGCWVGVLSFAIEREQQVAQDLASWSFFEYLADTDITNQRYGAPYNREGEETTGGKDFWLASRGIRVLFDDSPTIATAAEAQGINVYRINHPPENFDLHEGHKSYRSVIEAVDAFLKDLKFQRDRYTLTEPFFSADKVPWLSSKRHRNKIVCHRCHQQGHIARDCPNKGKGKGNNSQKGKGKGYRR